METYSRSAALLVALAVVAPAVGAVAQESGRSPTAATGERARGLFERGLALGDEGRWLEAVDAFRESAAIVDRASTVLNIANALYRLGRPLEARGVLNTYLRRPDVAADQQRIGEAAALLALATQAIATLRLQVSPADAEVQVDDVLVAGSGADRVIEIEPGEHTLRVEAPGHRTLRRRVASAPGRILAETFILGVLPQPELAPVSPGTGTVSPEETRSGPAARLAAPVEHADRGDDDSGGLLASPWFWTATAVVLAGAAAGLVYALSGETMQDPLPGANGLVVEALRDR